jgi:hypothetical protein
MLIYQIHRLILSLSTMLVSIHQARKFNISFRYIDDLLCANNRDFTDHVRDIYPEKLSLKETTESPTGDSFLDMFLTIDSDRLSTRLYDKRDDVPPEPATERLTDTRLVERLTISIFSLVSVPQVC